VRATAGREEAVDALLALYGDVLDRWRNAPSYPDAAEESRAASRYLRSVTPTLKSAILERAALSSRAAAAEAVPAQLHERISSLEARIADARATIGDMERSPFWRARKMWMALRNRGPGPQ
jgi:hypothetical protein